jgi:hypothetical protein
LSSEQSRADRAADVVFQVGAGQGFAGLLVHSERAIFKKRYVVNLTPFGWRARPTSMVGVVNHCGTSRATMRNILQLHSGHLPVTAGLPFLRVTRCGAAISRLLRHLKQ